MFIGNGEGFIILPAIVFIIIILSALYSWVKTLSKSKLFKVQFLACAIVIGLWIWGVVASILYYQNTGEPGYIVVTAIFCPFLCCLLVEPLFPKATQ